MDIDKAKTDFEENFNSVVIKNIKDRIANNKRVNTRLLSFALKHFTLGYHQLTQTSINKLEELSEEKRKKANKKFLITINQNLKNKDAQELLLFLRMIVNNINKEIPNLIKGNFTISGFECEKEIKDGVSSINLKFIEKSIDEEEPHCNSTATNINPILLFDVSSGKKVSLNDLEDIEKEKHFYYYPTCSAVVSLYLYYISSSTKGLKFTIHNLYKQKNGEANNIVNVEKEDENLMKALNIDEDFSAEEIIL